MVRVQLAAANMAQPREWHAYRAFVLGYVDALADLQASNGGGRPSGPESRTLSASVLDELCGGVQADALIGELADPVVRAGGDFTQGQRSALDDYDHWSEREMSGIETFIEASQAELLQLVRQPEIEAVPVRATRNGPLA